MARTASPTMSGPRRLVIVESPRKAQTIAGYLGRGYEVEASIGHIRDLPQNAAEVPPKLKKEPWGRLGVNVEREFEPVYVVPSNKRAQVRKLKDALKGADELFLATDEDREGEAIAWHLREVLKPTVPVRRMVFHEITPEAIQRALTTPRDIDQGLVDAQETRRILDQLYGYEVSPVLWKKVMPRLSAGRVQSVATRLVVERERERIAFRAASYWDLNGVFDTGRDTTDAVVSGDTQPTRLRARLVAVDGRRVVQGRDFTSTGQIAARSGDVLHLDEDRAHALAVALRATAFAVRSVDRKPYTRRPYAVPDHDAAAGGQPQARLQLTSHHAGRAAAVRERAHHLHAHGQHHVVGDRDQCCTRTSVAAVRPRIRARSAAAIRQQGEERAGGARSRATCR